MRDHLEASSSHRLADDKTKMKGKVVIDSGAWRNAAAFQHASQQGSTLKENCGGASTKDKAKKILVDSEVGASGDLPPWITSSFLER
jgi:hypothetical protein